GIYKYKIKNQNLMFEENILVSKLVSRIFKDNEGGYWITTLKEGVYYLKNNNFKSDDIVVSSIDVDTQNKVVYLGLKDKKILKRKINETPLTYTKITESDDIPQNIVFDKSTNSILADGYFETLRKIYSTGLNKKIKVIHPSTKAAIIEGNKIYRVNSNGFSKIVDDVEVYYSLRDGQKKYWCTSLIKENENIWIGTNQGLICFNNVKHLMLEPFKNNDILSTGVTCLEKFNNEIVLIGTKSFGLVLMKNGKIIDIIDEQKGLVGDLVKSVHVDYQDEIWVGTNNGLSRLNYHSSKNYHIQNITTKHGLISNEIAHIKSCDNTIFLVTPKNLIEFDKTKVLINKTRLPIHITGFKVNDKELKFTVDTIIELSYNENRIDINFESLNYKSLGNIEYKYKLSDIDTMWYNTTQNTVNFYGLSSGNYTFEVKAKNEDGFWSHPVKIRFKINPPFWLTWWFISVEILMLLLVIIGVFKFRETQIRIKSKNAQRLAENEKKIIELELKALKSQINPHFIFNTLNSIQHFISSNNFKDSNRYITNFSKLIRMVLNHSDKSYITLRDETEMLNLYLSLEQVRFSEGFDYVLKVNDNIDLDYDKIAPMLLQPFIENAIWHGLMNKKEKGFVEVSFSLDNDFLICTISDNGIGRDAAEKIKSARGIQNKSVGMTITKERLNIINNEVYENMNVEMIDLFDDKKQASGTKVIIKIKLN
ncbi:MAG: histidine kinase, partial [Flavobacteriales bacterium]|nr:histidine kinase [Flavobacteriales bacterium]